MHNDRFYPVKWRRPTANRHHYCCHQQVAALSCLKDVMAAMFAVWRHINNPVPSVDAYLGNVLKGELNPKIKLDSNCSFSTLINKYNRHVF